MDIATLKSYWRGRSTPLSLSSEVQWMPALPAHRMGSWAWNALTKEVQWSTELYALLGYHVVEDAPSLELFLATVHPEDREKVLAERRSIIDGVNRPIEFRLLRPDGSIREVLLDCTTLRGETNDLRKIVGTVFDLTEMRRAERNAARTLNFLNESQRIAQVGSWYWDPATEQFQWTDSLYNILGLTREDQGNDQLFLEAVHMNDREIVLTSRREAIIQGSTLPVEFRIVRPDGSIRFVQMQYRRMDASFEDHPVFLGTLIDITDRHHLEESLRQSRKMEAIGRLAGGVAHDFNNLLTIILGCTELLLERNPDPKLDQIVQAAEMGSALTHQLLAFSRQSVVKPEPLSLNEIVPEMAKVIERLIGDDIQLLPVLADRLPNILADRHQIEQILLNLAVNARDAMPNGGRIEVRTSYQTSAQHSSPPSSQSSVKPVNEVCLSVVDSGIGMSEETRLHIFEPFFTTKEPGKGTGLGLSTVFGIVSQAQGRIEVESEEGKGTTFHLYFPAMAFESEAFQRPILAHRKGNESVLVVEDNEKLRDVAVAFLEGNGYNVYAFGRPSAAFAWFQDHIDEVDLLITDILMPEKNGRRMAEEMQLVKPGLRALFVSGYSGGLEENLGKWDSFLQKPFRKQEFLAAVENVLTRQIE